MRLVSILVGAISFVSSFSRTLVPEDVGLVPTLEPEGAGSATATLEPEDVDSVSTLELEG